MSVALCLLFRLEAAADLSLCRDHACSTMAARSRSFCRAESHFSLATSAAQVRPRFPRNTRWTSVAAATRSAIQNSLNSAEECRAFDAAAGTAVSIDDDRLRRPRCLGGVVCLSLRRLRRREEALLPPSSPPTTMIGPASGPEVATGTTCSLPSTIARQLVSWIYGRLVGISADEELD